MINRGKVRKRNATCAHNTQFSLLVLVISQIMECVRRKNRDQKKREDWAGIAVSSSASVAPSLTGAVTHRAERLSVPKGLGCVGCTWLSSGFPVHIRLLWPATPASDIQDHYAVLIISASSYASRTPSSGIRSR